MLISLIMSLVSSDDLLLGFVAVIAYLIAICGAIVLHELAHGLKKKICKADGENYKIERMQQYLLPVYIQRHKLTSAAPCARKIRLNLRKTEAGKALC